MKTSLFRPNVAAHRRPSSIVAPDVRIRGVGHAHIRSRRERAITSPLLPQGESEALFGSS
jgi:hypothetical protein